MYKPLGKFEVGYCDFTYLDESQSEANAPDPKKHLVGGIFYPVNMEAKTSQLSSQRWIPYYGYATGFARFVLGMAGYSRMSVWQKIYKPILQALISVFAYLLGHFMEIPGFKGASLCKENSLPIIFVSHGVGGNRMVQSCMASELASQGFFVVALEHADGSASAVRMLTQNGYKWRYFGIHDDAQRRLQILHRLQEMRTGIRMLTEANQGTILPGLKFHEAPSSFAQSLKGKLDLGIVTSIGHSFGGGPSCALPLEKDSSFCTGIGLDPYWPPLAREHPVFNSAQRQASLLLVGSQSWNDPEQKSYLKTDKELEKKVLHACSRDNGGAGSIWVVMKGSGHASFTDADLLFGGFIEKLIPWGRPKSAVKPATLIAHMNLMILTYLHTHLPLTEEQKKRFSPSNFSTKANSEIGNKEDSSKKNTLNVTASQGEISEPWELVSPSEGTVDSPNFEMKSGMHHQGNGNKIQGEAGEVFESAIENQTQKIEATSGLSNSGIQVPDQSNPVNMPISRPCAHVHEDEKVVYEEILGKEGLYSLKIVP